MNDQETESWLIDFFNQTGDAFKPEPAPAPAPAPAPKRDCPRCGGSGRIPSYSHIKAGECFRCHGSGRK
jgi:hypothetical protein